MASSKMVKILGCFAILMVLNSFVVMGEEKEIKSDSPTNFNKGDTLKWGTLNIQVKEGSPLEGASVIEKDGKLKVVKGSSTTYYFNNPHFNSFTQEVNNPKKEKTPFSTISYDGDTISGTTYFSILPPAHTLGTVLTSPAIGTETKADSTTKSTSFVPYSDGSGGMWVAEGVAEKIAKTTGKISKQNGNLVSESKNENKNEKIEVSPDGKIENKYTKGQDGKWTQTTKTTTGTDANNNPITKTEDISTSTTTINGVILPSFLSQLIDVGKIESISNEEIKVKGDKTFTSSQKGNKLTTKITEKGKQDRTVTTYMTDAGTLTIDGETGTLNVNGKSVKTFSGIKTGDDGVITSSDGKISVVDNNIIVENGNEKTTFYNNKYSVESTSSKETRTYSNDGALISYKSSDGTSSEISYSDNGAYLSKVVGYSFEPPDSKGQQAVSSTEYKVERGTFGTWTVYNKDGKTPCTTSECNNVADALNKKGGGEDALNEAKLRQYSKFGDSYVEGSYGRFYGAMNWFADMLSGFQQATSGYSGISMFYDEPDPIIELDEQMTNVLKGIDYGWTSEICKQRMNDAVDSGMAFSAYNQGGASAHVEGEVVPITNFNQSNAAMEYLYKISFAVDPGDETYGCDIEFEVFTKNKIGKMPLLYEKGKPKVFKAKRKDGEISYAGKDLIFVQSQNLVGEVCIFFKSIEPKTIAFKGGQQNPCLLGVEEGDELCNRIFINSPKNFDFGDPCQEGPSFFMPGCWSGTTGTGKQPYKGSGVGGARKSGEQFTGPASGTQVGDNIEARI